VALGVATFGYRVIKTIGSKLTCIDFHKGFYIEWASAMATMIATLLELPVSTTHCQVGAIIGVGLVTWQQRVGVVDWRLFGKIFLTWVLTLPIAGGISAVIALAVKGALTKVDGY
jgi:sodium-dependent phosphate transporter